MKSIVIPTDFSENSIQAIDFAVNKLGDNDCVYTLLYVYQIPSGGQSGLFYLLEEMQKQADREMKELMETLTVRFAGKNFKTKVIQGDLADQSNGVANDCNADCVVMGTKGASGIKEVLIGSNTVALMNALKKPLYAIPEHHQSKSIKNLMVAFDGKPFDEKVANAIKAFALKHKLPIDFFHIRIKEENPLQNWSEVKKYFEDVKIQLIEKQANSFEEGLQKATEDKESLLVMIRHKQSFWERLFKLSDSRKALMHSKLPVLVIPES